MNARIYLPVLLTLMSPIPVVTAQNVSERTVSQPAPAADAVPIKAKASGKPKTAAEKVKIEQQRALALSLLISLANDAGSFPDQKLRARTLARIADGIWSVDPDQARSFFVKAWDAAGVADQDSARLMKEDRDRQAAAGRGVAIARAPDIRSEVLRLAAKRDRALGEELLEKLKRDKALEVVAQPGPTNPFNLAEAMAQRLRLARQLLDVDVPRALQFADPALTGVTMQGLSFLSFLRDKDAGAADLRYGRLLDLAANDQQADANTVSLLSSYIFSPQRFVTFDRDGGSNTSQSGRQGPPENITPALRNKFFQVATQILMRPLAPPEQDQTSSGIEGKYLIIKRLLPLFERHAAKEATELMRGQLAALGSSVREQTRNRNDDQIRRDIQPEETQADRERSLLDQIDRVKTSKERDELYLQLIMFLLEKGDPRARDFVDKIEDSDWRKQMRAYVDVSLVIHYLDNKKPDEALSLATSGELTHFQRVWAYTQAVRQIEETQRDKAISLLGDAAEEARRIGGSDPDRARALVGVASAWFQLDRNRAWELITEAVKAANATEGYSGEDSRMVLRLQTAGMNSMRTNTIESFDLPSLFRTLTKDNYDRAVGLARNFEADSPRATALISIARGVLDEK